MTDRAVERESRPDFEPADFSVLRTPLLPFDELVAFGAGLTAARAHPERVEAALAEDRVLLRARLRAIVARPEVREALFVASPSLHESLGEWFERPDSERGQKVERTLVRYFERMAARSTPFGLFAGCSIASLAGSTRLELAPRRCYQRRTRLDMDYLLALSEALPRDPALRPNLRFRPNSSLYRAAGRLRYAQARIGQNGR
ncbi:MAG: Lanthionine biosynthesis protein LanB, partial [Deltaproteobacteria bacterium]